MTDAGGSRILALITVPPSLEEVVIDVLLSRENSSAFTSVAAHGHGAAHEDLTLAELVSGRRKQTQFQVELTEADVAALLQTLSAAIPGGDYHCSFLPLHQAIVDTSADRP